MGSNKTRKERTEGWGREESGAESQDEIKQITQWQKY